MAACSMQSVDLTKDAINVLGISFSYNLNLINQKITVKLLPKFMAFKTMEDEKSFC